LPRRYPYPFVAFKIPQLKILSHLFFYPLETAAKSKKKKKTLQIFTFLKKILAAFPPQMTKNANNFGR
jgi:hypothetical protein